MNIGYIVYILGWVLTIESSFMFLPCVCALCYGEKKSGLCFLAIASFFLVMGLAITRRKPKNQQFFTKEGFASVGFSWIILSIVGALPLYISGQFPNFTDALFEVVSGFTTTGASVCLDVEVLDHCTLLWRSFTHWLGGMGVFVFLLAVLPMTGGYNMHLMRAESPGPTVGKLVPKIRDTAKILYGIYFGITFLMFILLMIAGMPVFDSICTALGTAGTGGFGIKGDSMNSYSVLIKWIVTIFMILFGVNFNFYFYLLGKDKMSAFKLEEVRWYIIIIIAATSGIVIDIASSYDTIFNAVTDAAFSVGSVITTTGFATADFNLWPVMSRTILVMIMFCGACAGSTGGGIKVSRFIIIFKLVKQEIYSFIHPRSVRTITLDGKPVEKNTIKAVLTFFAIYIFVFIGSLILITFDGNDIVTNFTAVTATLNNIGPGLEIVGPTGNFEGFSIFAKYVFIFDMLAGRLELLPMLVLFSPSLWKKNS